jgi:NAD(P)-dependent dehydrogenase (short-subunit alcohol dehydrogenase family)
LPRPGAAASDGGPASVVFVSSAAGKLGYPMRSPYATSKWGVVGLTKTLAWELGASGIRVNAVLPGIVDTPLARQVLADRSAALGITQDELWGRFLSRNALPTPVVVDDVVNTVLFLLSPLAGHISGQALSVDGGADSIAVMDR